MLAYTAATTAGKRAMIIAKENGFTEILELLAAANHLRMSALGDSSVSQVLNDSDSSDGIETSGSMGK